MSVDENGEARVTIVPIAYWGLVRALPLFPVLFGDECGSKAAHALPMDENGAVLLSINMERVFVGLASPMMTDAEVKNRVLGMKLESSRKLCEAACADRRRAT